MKSTSGAIRIGVFLSFVFAAAAAGGACAADLSGLYVGGNVGRTRIDTNNALYQSELEGQAAEFGSLDFTKASLDKRNTAWWVDAGYMIWPGVAIEASYLHLGSLHNQVSGTYTQAGGNPQSVYAATLVHSVGPALGMLFRLPLVERLDVDLRLADYYSRTTLTDTLILNGNTATKETADRSSLLLGLGATYAFDTHWSVTLDFIRVENAGNDTKVVTYNVDMLSAGASYSF